MHNTNTQPTLDDLLAQERELQEKIKHLKEQEVAGAMKQIKELMTRYDIKLKDLELTLKKLNVNQNRKPVAIKFKNPETGATWTGRGVMPIWLRASPNIEMFRVKSQ